MPLGWIDFSKSERNKVLSVLDSLSEPRALDEIGIAAIRDGFSDVFFPGTSTLHTRAKYFVLIPYIFKDLELSSEDNPNRILTSLNEKQRRCAEKLLDKGIDTEGIIGRRSLLSGNWVKRAPSEIYWGGLRRYDLYRGGNLSITEYCRYMCASKKERTPLLKLGNKRDDDDEIEGDDKDAGSVYRRQFWNLPIYHDGWNTDLSIKLTEEEGVFLKHQIITSCPDTLFSWILENNVVDILSYQSFQDLAQLYERLPEQIKKDFVLAIDISRFVLVLRVIYNIIVSDGKNDEANQAWEQMHPALKSIASMDLEGVLARLQAYRDIRLCSFLREAQNLMMSDDIEGLKNLIKRREREIKDARAKTLHPGEFGHDSWFGGYELDYRFNNAKSIIRDIFESEGLYAKPE